MLSKFLLPLLLTAGVLLGQSNLEPLIRFHNVFLQKCATPPCPANGRITTAQASTFLDNNGQSHHKVLVLFPTAVGAQSPIQVRLEASFDGTTWFPIMQDVVSVPLRGATVFTMVQANGTFPALRVNSLTATPGALPMEVYYAGSPFPEGFLNCTGDRCVFTGSDGYDKATFVVCNGSACAVGTNLTNEYIVVASVTFRECIVYAKTAPTGASLLVDINKNGTSIFGAPKITLPAGSNGPVVATNFASPPTAVRLDRLTVDIDQIGSGTAGQDVTVTCVLDLQ